MDKRYNEDRLWYNSYTNIYRMMELRNYNSEDRIISFNEFRGLRDQWIKSRLDPIIRFDKNLKSDVNGQLILEVHAPVTYIYFAGTKVNKDVFESISSFLESKRLEFNPPEQQFVGRRAINVHAIIITESIVSQTTSKLSAMEPTLTTRADRDITIATKSIKLIFLADLQYNPLEHAMQPKFRLISDELEKERLRLRLVKHSQEKNKTLFDLLPLMYDTDPVSIWYDAQIGDVFYCLRSIGGITPYYRIVVPATGRPQDIKGKKDKKK